MTLNGLIKSKIRVILIKPTKPDNLQKKEFRDTMIKGIIMPFVNILIMRLKNQASLISMLIVFRCIGFCLATRTRFVILRAEFVLRVF